MTYQQLVLGQKATRTLTLTFTVGLGALSACSSDPGTNTRTGLQIDGGVAGGSGGAANGASGGSVSRAGSSGKGGGDTSAGGGTSANAGGSVSAGGQTATGGATSGTGGSSGSTGTGGAKSAGGASASDGGATCGGRRGNVCAADEFCDYGAGPSCGAADNTGLCTKRPTVCTDDCPGLCGCDGRFYCNACGANAAGVPTTGDKSCMNADDSGTPTCTSDAECGAGLKCCYPCGRIGCKNACIKPLSPGQCPMYP